MRTDAGQGLATSTLHEQQGSRRRRVWVRWMLALLLATSTALIVWWAVWLALQATTIDFLVYLAGARAIRAGSDLYGFGLTSPVGPLGFTYPPFAALVFEPLLLLDVRRAFFVWQLLHVAALAAVCYLVARRLPRLAGSGRLRALRAWALWVAVFAGSLAFEPVRENLFFGQVNMLIVLVLLVDATVLRRSRGFLTGVAAGIKVTPGIFMVLLAFTRNWRALAWSAVGLATTLILGWLAAPAETRRYWTHELFVTSRVGDPVRTSNASLNGIALRLLSAQDARVGWLVLATAVVALGFVAGIRWASRDPLVSYTAIGCTGLLVSPVSWPHHWIWAVPMTAALAALSVRALVQRRRARAAGLLCATILVAMPFVLGARRWIFPLTAQHSISSDLVSSWYAIGTVIGLVALALAASGYPREEPG